MTQEKIVEEFVGGAVNGVSGGIGNLIIQDDKLIHYRTVIAQRFEDKIILNVTRYSLVTGRIQKMVNEKTTEKQLLTAHKVPEGYKGDLNMYLKKEAGN